MDQVLRREAELGTLAMPTSFGNRHTAPTALLVHELGVPTVAGRGAAIRQHVLHVPAPIVADALGYHHVTTTRLATQAGATWSRYATSDHSPPQTPRPDDS